MLHNPQCQAIGAGACEGRLTKPVRLHCHAIYQGQFLLGATVGSLTPKPKKNELPV